MKVFEVIEISCVDYETEVITRLFATKEGAEKEFQRRKKNAQTDAECCLTMSEREEESEDLYYRAYKRNSNILWDVSVFVQEKELGE